MHTHVLFLVLSFVDVGFATPVPNPDLWNVVTNPNNGERVVPLIVYDRGSGLLSIDTLGLNRVDETPDYLSVPGPVLGDDVGLIYVSIERSAAAFNGAHVIHPGFDGGLFQGLLVITSLTSGNRFTLLSERILGNGFLWPGRYDWLQLMPGLTDADFGEVEVDVVFDGLRQDAALMIARNNGVTIAPEPSGIAEFSSLLFALSIFMRFTFRCTSSRV